MKRILKYLILFAIGGTVYMGIEMLVRGRTHWSMFLVGGLCFILVGGINNWLPWEMSIILQMLISAAVITTVEFSSGLILNVWLGWDVWDYSNIPGNIMGQICPLFSAIWFLFSIVPIVVDDYLRWRWFGEEPPRYYLFGRRASDG